MPDTTIGFYGDETDFVQLKDNLAEIIYPTKTNSKNIKTKIEKMKNTILLLFMVCFNISYSQDFSFPINENYGNIIKTLFQAELVNKNEYKWKLNISDKFQFSEFEKDSLYTSIDTTFTFKENDKKNTFIITSTNGKNQSCHACSPSLSLIKIEYDYDKNKIIVKDFKKFVTKYGTWGEPGKVSLIKISNNEYCIKVISGYSGMGMTAATTYLFYNGEKILSYTSYEDNSGATDDKTRLYKNTTSIAIDKNYRITLNKKGSEINETTGKTINVISSTHYNFLDGELIKVCK